jgi:7,8-dihydropterin-6-yl-methyl-4-(beta-D-ribofuranosyl)aminobenzene 5'-phosphate synthase
MIKSAKNAKGAATSDLVMDLHPGRPEYRGLMAGEAPFSLPADPSFEEIKNAGATVETSKETHTVLDNMFLVAMMSVLWVFWEHCSWDCPTKKGALVSGP